MALLNSLPNNAMLCYPNRGKVSDKGKILVTGIFFFKTNDFYSVTDNSLDYD